MTVEQIFEKTKQTFPYLGKGTVYRNLNLLADEGIIRRLQIPGRPIRFDSNTVPHQHMVCVSCGNIVDIADLDPAEMHRLAGPQTEIVDQTLVIYVVCDECAI